MNIFFTLAFLFAVGGCFGWVLELFFRRLFTAKKWLNPGFLVGPCLPLYGFGLCFLYFLSGMNLTFIDNNLWREILRVLLMGLAMTLVEYIAGKIFIVGMHVKLWDYSDQPGNIEGIVCPLFSIFWTAIGAGYCFLLHPLISTLTAKFLFHPNLLFPLGIFFGILIVDVFYSTKLLAKIRAFAKENNLVVKLEELKGNLQEKIQKNRFSHFVFILREAASHGSENLKQYAGIITTKVKKRKKGRKSAKR